MILTTDTDGNPCYHVIDEHSSHSQTRREKLPGGHMRHDDRNILTALCRELAQEAGRLVTKARLVVAANWESYTSTPHYKIGFLVEKVFL